MWSKNGCQQYLTVLSSAKSRLLPASKARFTPDFTSFYNFRNFSYTL